MLNRVGEISEERWPTGPGTNLKTWRVPQCPFLMACSSAVLEQILQEVEGGRNLRRGDRETGGVLFGIYEPSRICILASEPLECEHAMGPGFVLSDKDEKRLAQLISAAASDPELSGLQALGWYHSHIRSRIFLSERDLQIHSRYFAAPYQIALVIHPRSDGPARAGFFFTESSGEMRTEASYEEFAIEAPPPAAPVHKHPVVSEPAPSPRRTPSPAEPEPHREAICPKCGSKHLRRSRRTGPIERFREVFGFYPYRCHECLSRSFLKTSPKSTKGGPVQSPETAGRAQESAAAYPAGNAPLGRRRSRCPGNLVLLDPGHRPKARCPLRSPRRLPGPLSLCRRACYPFSGSSAFSW
jgi:proteasome lid subunit RPN8/RPN11/DNA-directed RNA polymerase subunit RPC12/RpoP